MNKTPSPSVNEDYEAIEAAVLETARGRWFLAEYLRRHQAAETRALLNAIRKLENALGADGQRSRDILAITKRTAGQLAEIGQEPFATTLPEAVLHMAEEAAMIATRMEKSKETDGDTEWNLPAQLAAQQHLMARKLEVVAGCLREISTICGEEAPQQTEEPRIKPEQARWFASDAELFEEESPVSGPLLPKEVPVDGATDKERTGHLSIIIEPGQPKKVHRETRITDVEEKDRPRIIITRKRSSNEVDIPMASHEEGTGTAVATVDQEPEKSEA